MAEDRESAVNYFANPGGWFLAPMGGTEINVKLVGRRMNG